MNEEYNEDPNVLPNTISNYNTNIINNGCSVGGDKQQLQQSLDTTTRYEFKIAEVVTLIQKIKACQLIWNKTHPEYSNSLSRSMAFEQIASVMKIPVNDVRWKWQILRKEYFKKISINRRNCGVPKRRPWKWANELSFLDSTNDPIDDSTARTIIKQKNNSSSLLAPQAYQTSNTIHQIKENDLDSTSNSDNSINNNQQQPQLPHINEIINLEDYENDDAKFFCETVYSPVLDNHQDNTDYDNDQDDNSKSSKSKRQKNTLLSINENHHQIIDLEDNNDNDVSIFDFNYSNGKRKICGGGGGNEILSNIKVHKINTNQQQQPNKKQPEPSKMDTTIQSMLEFLKVQNQLLLDKSQKDDLLLKQLIEKNNQLFTIQEREQCLLQKQQDPFHAYILAKLSLLQDVPRTSQWINKFQMTIDQAFQDLFNEFIQIQSTPSSYEK